MNYWTRDTKQTGTVRAIKNDGGDRRNEELSA